MRRMSADEKKILSFFFSNLHNQVFTLLNMPEVLKGALFSRYSRSVKNLRELFLDEYLKDEELGIIGNWRDLERIVDLQKLLNTGKAQEFYRKWLSQYGDDSISELGGVHVGIENISVVATKSIEERRIGLSPLEKSTRYVRFDNKVNGRYLYYRDKEIIKSKYGPLFIETMDYLFTTYTGLIRPLTIYFEQKYPKPAEVSDKAYVSSIRSKACDTARGLLPMGLLTNMGVFGNGRAFEYLITKMYAHEMPEVRGLGAKIHRELTPVIGSFLERLNSEKGRRYINYLSDSRKAIKNLTCSRADFKNFGKTGHSCVRLVQKETEAVVKAAASILYPDLSLSWEKLYTMIRKMPEKKLAEIIETYVEKREGRWHKVGRAFEEIYYGFEIISDLGVYKDLQRHRILTNFRQRFSTEHGFETPPDIIDAGLKKTYEGALKKADRTYRKIARTFPDQAQYVVCHGHLGRWRIKLNLREAFHLCELRSSPQGHPGYRKVAQEIYHEIKRADPILGTSMKFVNFTQPGLERLSAEVRKEEKLAAMKTGTKSPVVI